MADDLAKNLVYHRVAALATDMIAELGFDHRERRLDVAALVIMRKEFVSLELEQVEHLPPEAPALACMDGLEGNERH
jgi:hypothetical protein